VTTRTADQALVREINLSIILNTLRNQAPLSRAKLAATTGLNKTTVSSLVKELLDAHFIRELGVGNSVKAGRKGILIELNPQVGCIIGAEIGVDFIAIILTDFAGTVHWRQREPTTAFANQAAVVQRVLELIRAAVAQAECDCRSVLGLGLGVPGLVDAQAGTLLFAPNLHWRDVPLRCLLEREFRFPIYVDNEATMAALGESYFGVARECNYVLYVSAGIGLGGGVVLNHRILPGARGLAGEFGHMTMLPDGPACNCGNRGCWETLVSQWAVFRRVREAIAKGQASSLIELTHNDLDALTVPLVVQAACAQDPVALEALAETGRYLGIGIANLINALNPEMVVFGGSMSLASDFLLPELTRVVEARALPWSRNATRIVAAAHGLDACVMGGIATVNHHILSQPKGANASPLNTPRVAYSPA
jgi:glucokinase-like ROK family protein